MGRNDSLTPLRYESAAQEKRNERAPETKNTDRLLKILAKKGAAHCQGRLIPLSLDSPNQTCQLSSYSRRSAGENQTSDRCFVFLGG
jgi:hypothetical protein